MPLFRGHLEHAVTTTILTMTLSLVWGGVLTIVITLVARGLGVAIVPASALPPSHGSSLTVKPLRPAITRRIGILRLSEKTLMPASQAFLEIFQPRFLAAARGGQSRSHLTR